MSRGYSFRDFSTNEDACVLDSVQDASLSLTPLRAAEVVGDRESESESREQCISRDERKYYVQKGEVVEIDPASCCSVVGAD